MRRKRIKKDFIHDYILIGYNDKKKSFYSVGYTQRNLYEEFLIPYHDLYESISNPAMRRIVFYLLKFNPDKVYELDLETVIGE